MRKISSGSKTRKQSKTPGIDEDPEIKRQHVPVGKEFQAQVPEWSGPVTTNGAAYREPVLILDHSEFLNFHDRTSINTSEDSYIGNWLQCKEVITGMGVGLDGKVCGKWRRAPLFEEQTKRWDCFHSVLWDPTHSDCAAPQELETDQVLKQLKYIEYLRSDLTAKRQKTFSELGLP